MRKHIAPPATLDEIRRTLGITKEDEEIVDRVLRELGYDKIDSATPSDACIDAAPDRVPIRTKEKE